MRRPGKSLLAGLVVGMLLATGSGTALASSDGWQASTVFSIDPREVPGVAPGATRMIYRLLDPQGQQVGSPMEATPSDPLEKVQVPSVSGVYTLEGRLEDAAGNELRRASTPLRFDDAVPPPPVAHGPGRWLLGGEQAILKLDPPAAVLPLSGISAYEVTLNPGGVRVAAGTGKVSLGLLQEGVTEARVVALSGSGVRSQPRTATSLSASCSPR